LHKYITRLNTFAPLVNKCVICASLKAVIVCEFFFNKSDVLIMNIN